MQRGVRPSGGEVEIQKTHMVLWEQLVPINLPAVPATLKGVA